MSFVFRKIISILSVVVVFSRYKRVYICDSSLTHFCKTHNDKYVSGKKTKFRTYNNGIKTRIHEKKVCKRQINQTLNFSAEMCFLSNNIYDYYNVSQGKITIPGIDDHEEMGLTDVSSVSLEKYLNFFFHIYPVNNSTSNKMNNSFRGYWILFFLFVQSIPQKKSTYGYYYASWDIK